MQQCIIRISVRDIICTLCDYIKLEESQHWQHGENKAKKENQTWQHGENRAQQKERKAQGNYTCQRERKKQVEATGVWKEEETSKKKNQMLVCYFWRKNLLLPVYVYIQHVRYLFCN